MPGVPRPRSRVGSRTLSLALRVATLILCVPALALGQAGTHLVAPGETLTSIARRYDTTVDALRAANDLRGDLLRAGETLRLPAPPGWRTLRVPEDGSWAALASEVGVGEATLRAANPGLADPAGAEVRVPPVDGVLAWPQPGEDLLAFASRLGLPPAALASRNGLRSPYALEPGAPLLLPEGTGAAGVGRGGGGGSAAPATAASTLGVAVGGASVGGPGGAGAAPGARATPGAAVLGAEDPRDAHDALRVAALRGLPELFAGRTLAPPDDGFAWPLGAASRITSSFGWRNVSVGGNRYHQGLDLGAAPGTPVHAARDGVVTRAGWVGAYGWAVYVAHRDGYETRYAHLSRIDVRVGDRLRRGDAVGLVGSTGASTGPHLHFEARLAGRALDPLSLLPLPR